LLQQGNRNNIKDFISTLDTNGRNENDLVNLLFRKYKVKTFKIISMKYGSPVSFDLLGIARVVELLRDSIKDLVWRGKHERFLADNEKEQKKLETESKKIEIENQKQLLMKTGLENEKLVVEVAIQKIELITKARDLNLSDSEENALIGLLSPHMEVVAQKINATSNRSSRKRISQSDIKLLTDSHNDIKKIKKGVRKQDLARDAAEQITFDRLMNLPKDDYDVSEAYNLLFLFENELRRLIAHQFDIHADWWRKGIPKDIYVRASRKGSEHIIKGVELLKRLTLSDLFKITKYKENWEQVFEPIFLTLSYIESREAIILPFRNKVAHTNYNISQLEIDEFFAVTKNMIVRMHPYLHQ
jgi:hypothetical protein